MEKLSRKDMEIRRLRGAKLLADGTSQADVARICGVSRATTSKWAIALEIGADLKMRKAPGRPPKLTLPKTIALCKMVSANPQWTLEQIRQAINNQLRVSYNVDHVSRLVRKLGLREARRYKPREMDLAAMGVAPI